MSNQESVNYREFVITPAGESFQIRWADDLELRFVPDDAGNKFASVEDAKFYIDAEDARQRAERNAH